MKHTDFKTVQRYVQEIEAINLDLVHVTGGGSGLGVTIQGRYQDDTIVNQVRPVVVGILQRAKAERILALRELGVDIPDEPVAITDAERIDHLEHLVSEAYVSACFEMDGGVHLTIERPSSRWSDSTAWCGRTPVSNSYSNTPSDQMPAWRWSCWPARSRRNGRAMLVCASLILKPRSW